MATHVISPPNSRRIRRGCAAPGSGARRRCGAACGCPRRSGAAGARGGIRRRMWPSPDRAQYCPAASAIRTQRGQRLEEDMLGNRGLSTEQRQQDETGSSSISQQRHSVPPTCTHFRRAWLCRQRCFIRQFSAAAAAVQRQHAPPHRPTPPPSPTVSLTSWPCGRAPPARRP